MVRLRGRFLVLSRCCWISAQLHFSRWGFFRLYVVVSIGRRGYLRNLTGSVLFVGNPWSTVAKGCLSLAFCLSESVWDCGPGG